MTPNRITPCSKINHLSNRTYPIQAFQSFFRLSTAERLALLGLLEAVFLKTVVGQFQISSVKFGMQRDVPDRLDGKFSSLDLPLACTSHPSP